MCCLGAPIALLWRFRELPEDLTPILTSRHMCCLGAPIALLWRFCELPEGLAS